MTTELSLTLPKPAAGTALAHVPHGVAPIPADDALRWFLSGEDPPSRTVTCPKGGEAATAASLVAAIRATGQVRIVAAAPTRPEVVKTAAALVAVLDPGADGSPHDAPIGVKSWLGQLGHSGKKLYL